ncbi:MAG TPA: AI-2E family transporter [Longimicrobiales bacterium]|nr:AI-2E family transporter [Longimicrobiales bacterium]
MARLHGAELPVVRVAAVLMVLALFLYSLTPALSPLVLLLALLLLLSPYAGEPSHTRLALMAVLLTGLWLLDTLGSLLAPFILALVLAYILDPAVDRLERRLPRTLAILLLAIPLVTLLALALVLGLPALGRQVEDLIAGAPAAIERLITWLEAARGRLLALRIPLLEDVVLERLRALDREQVVAALESRQAAIGQRIWQGVIGLGRGLGTVLTIFGYVVLTPVLTFYLLKDWDSARARVQELFPRRHAARWSAFIAEYDRLLSRYLRGQVLAAALVGVLTWLGLWIVGFPYSGLVGTVAGVFNVVPYLGLVVSLIPGLIIALVSGGVVANLVKLALVFGIVQFLDGSVVGPRIVGESVGIHPVWVILALAVGGFFFGFVGLLVAVPGAVLLKLLIVGGLVRYRASRVYGDTEAATEE